MNMRRVCMFPGCWVNIFSPYSEVAGKHFWICQSYFLLLERQTLHLQLQPSIWHHTTYSILFYSRWLTFSIHHLPVFSKSSQIIYSISKQITLEAISTEKRTYIYDNLWPASRFAIGQETETNGAVIDANEIIQISFWNFQNLCSDKPWTCPISNQSCWMLFNIIYLFI